MTALLEKVFQQASTLPDDLQDSIAQNLMKELEWELNWDESLKSSQNTLDTIGLAALKEFKASKTEEKEIDEL